MDRDTEGGHDKVAYEEIIINQKVLRLNQGFNCEHE